jgi:hypothetical protein
MRLAKLLSMCFVALTTVSCGRPSVPEVSCPPPYAEMAPAPVKPTARQIGELEVRVEVRREDERDAHAACYGAVNTLLDYIRKTRQ